MAKRNLAGAWASLFRRNLALINRNLKTTQRKVAAAVVKAAKVAKATKPVKPTKRPTQQPTKRPTKQPPATRRPVASAGGKQLSGVALGTGGARRYLLFRPAGITRGEHLPLLVMLHGCSQDAPGFALCTRMNAVAARERFLVLYPEQERLANSQGCWNWFDTRGTRAASEAASILRAVDQVCLQQPVDRARIAVAGLSAGASMAALLASLHPQRFRAVVMHSGIPPGTADSALTALRAMRGRRSTRPLVATPEAFAQSWPPLLVIHGTADNVVSPVNGQAAVLAWADAAGAKARPPRQVQRGQRYPMTVTDYTCRSRTVATHVAVQGLGHAWSGGGAGQAYADARGPDASRVVWAFAARQFKLRAG